MARSKRSKGLKDKEYLEWIASLPCVICMHLWQGLQRRERSMQMIEERLMGNHQRTFTEVAHVGTRGLSQKCSDRETLPLCVIHHRTGPDAHHKLGRRFWTYHGLDRDAFLKYFNDRYEARKQHDLQH